MTLKSVQYFTIDFLMVSESNTRTKVNRKPLSLKISSVLEEEEDQGGQIMRRWEQEQRKRDWEMETKEMSEKISDGLQICVVRSFRPSSKTWLTRTEGLMLHWCAEKSSCCHLCSIWLLLASNCQQMTLALYSSSSLPLNLDSAFIVAIADVREAEQELYGLSLDLVLQFVPTVLLSRGLWSFCLPGFTEYLSHYVIS